MTRSGSTHHATASSQTSSPISSSGQSGAGKSLKPSTIRVGRRYRANRLAQNYDAIVIGSGMGGLATAAMMSKAGKKVLVLEQHYTAGGYTHSYGRNGYEWDVGVHYIGDVGHPDTQIRKLFDYVTDGQLEWAPMDEVYDCFFIGDRKYDLRSGKDGFIESLSNAFPAEKKAIREYVRLISKANRQLPGFWADRLLPEWSGRLLNQVSKRLLPRYLNSTTLEVLQTLTDNQELIAVLTGQWGDCGLPPASSSFLIHAVIAKHYMHGGYYPIGGAARIAETVIPVIQASGGEVFTYAMVEEILVENGRATGVLMADGERIRAPHIVSNAGVFNTFGRLLTGQESARLGYRKALQGVSPSFAHLGLYIGLDETAAALELPRTNFWIYPSNDHDASVSRFMADRSQPMPVVYISFPSAKDPDFQRRCPGKATIEIVAPTAWEDFAQWKDAPWGKRGAAYDELKERLSQQLLEQLYAKLPHLRGKVAYYELSTPLSTAYFCLYQKGELYGLDHTPERFEQTWLRPRTRLPGLYLTGQDILTCGVGGALISGLLTTVSVLGWRAVPIVRDLFVGKTRLRSAGIVAEAG